MTAVAPVVAKCGGLWVGWPGIFPENDEEQIPESEDEMTPTAGLLSKQVAFPLVSLLLGMSFNQFNS